MPGPRLARNLPTGVSAPSGCSSSTWFSPTSSSAASTPCSVTVSRWTTGIPKVVSKRARASSRDSTATPTWTIRSNMPRGRIRAGRLRGPVAGIGGGDAQRDARPGPDARHFAEDPVEVGPVEDPPLEQAGGELVELRPVGGEEVARGALGLEGELALLLVADAAGDLRRTLAVDPCALAGVGRGHRVLVDHRVRHLGDL